MLMSKAYEEVLDLLAVGLNRAGGPDFVPSVEAKARVEELLQKEKSEGLLPDETAELNDFLQLEHLLRMAKARARALGAA